MDASYVGREQSAAKHLMLARYLERLAYKIGLFRRDVTLNYVDGFAGPWESKSADLSDTSPYLALKTLLQVRGELEKHGCEVVVRAFFVSLKQEDATRLRSLSSSFLGAHVDVVASTFEAAVAAASVFVRQGRNPFAFIFIDPTGWTGFGMRTIAPLLAGNDNEVLINFMTGDIIRFVDKDEPQYLSTFVDLFGDEAYRHQWAGLRGLDREDQIVATYCDRVRRAGGYRHCVSSVVLNPTADRSRFHLVYGTRSDEGLVTFREIERGGLAFQRTTRASAKQRKEEQRSRQSWMFPADDLVSSTYEDELRERYATKAWAHMDAMVTATDTMIWDELVLAALQVPMISENDVKEWARKRAQAGVIELVIPAGTRVPKRKRGDRVRRL
ncbi:MAG TPA: three-Cys-motif partner protein TcmP [Kofleriaceae bacterium]|nr:three-Cys-motif partner protein TcmP [Kofleriaceae bacterium]